MFVLMNILLNYDTGVIPASLIEIGKEIELSYQEKAALGSLVYLGLCIASLIVPLIFQHYSAAKTLIVMITVNLGFCLLFSFTLQNIYVMYAARLGMGFTQAFCVIYAPVWTNEFSPHDKATRWMGLLQVAVPIGIVLGYSVAGLFISIGGPFFTWRRAIQVQALCELPVILALYYSDHRSIDIIDTSQRVSVNSIVCPGQQTPADSHGVRMDSINIVELESFWGQLKMLFTNRVFVFITLSLCSLYFVVTGIQYWMTMYMVKVLGAEQVSVLVAFIVICTSAPLLGVFTGSYIVDRMGGYKGENLLVALKLCVTFGMFSCGFALLLMFAKAFMVVSVFLWFVLFFGGCLIPTATGINVNSLPKEYQSSASSMSQLVFNLGGYFLAPVLSAAVMDLIKDTTVGLLWGFRFILLVSLIGLLFIVIAWVVAHNRFRSFSSFYDENADTIEFKFSTEDVQMEIIRRVGHPY